MTDLQLKDRLVYILFFSKFIVITFSFFFWQTKGYSLQQLIEILTIVVPLFSVHLTLVIKNLLQISVTKKKQLEKTVRKPLVIFSQVLPIGYMLFMIWVIFELSMVSGDAVTFSQTKTLLGAGETIFGVYLGMIISTLLMRGNN